MLELKTFKKIEDMNKNQLFETLLLIELIEKKELKEIIKDYLKDNEKHTDIEKQIIENKIRLIESLNVKKYIKKENIKNMTIYTYENIIKIYGNSEIDVKDLQNEINKHNKYAYTNKKGKIEKIKKEDLSVIIQKENNIFLK